MLSRNGAGSFAPWRSGRPNGVLDIGSGPGLLAHDMAVAVGPEGRVCGIDISDAMLAMSEKRCVGQRWVKFQSADATKLPYPDGSFDAAVSTQVYEYVADIPAALAELSRVLRPGGRAVILDTDYDSLVIHTEHPARMERVLAAWDEHFVHAGLPRFLSPQLRDAGFTIRSVTPSRCSIPNITTMRTARACSASWRHLRSDVRA